MTKISKTIADSIRIYAGLADLIKVSSSTSFSSSWAEESLLSDRNNNELLIINLATVRAERNSKVPPAQSRTVGSNFKRPESKWNH